MNYCTISGKLSPLAHWQWSCIKFVNAISIFTYTTVLQSLSVV